MMACNRPGTREPLVLRVSSCLYSDPECLEQAVGRLTGLFGQVALRSRTFPFDLSGYYEEEMGEGLSRVWLCFEKLMSPAKLASFKVDASDIEAGLRRSFCGGRSVNIDPGYLDYGKLVLASFKEAPDKIYMGDGVWAHTVLRYGSGRFDAPDHSFPDFKDGRFDEFFVEARSLLRRLLRDSTQTQSD
jgi:hypothetical protein